MAALQAAADALVPSLPPSPPPSSSHAPTIAPGHTLDGANSPSPNNDHTSAQPLQSGSGTRRRGSAATSTARDGLPFMGILSEDEVGKLRAEFGDLLLCPGTSGNFGSSADRDGRVFLPGAAVAVGYKEARRVPLGWKAKVDSDERFAWWPAAAEKHPSIEPLKGSHLLSGLDQEEWKTYTAAYRKLSASRAHQRMRERKRDKARERYAASTSASPDGG